MRHKHNWKYGIILYKLLQRMSFPSSMRNPSLLMWIPLSLLLISTFVFCGRHYSCLAFSSGAIPRCRPAVPRSSVLYATAAADGTVLVIGGTSGIGQLVSHKLAGRQKQVRATSRDASRARELLDHPNIVVVELDILKEDDATALEAAMKDVSTVVISVGTTAFPTLKWKGGNTPVNIDEKAVSRIAAMAAKAPTVKTVLLVTTVGVERTEDMPFKILNLFGVLDAKRAGEAAIQTYSTVDSGYQYAIVRPGRLVGGPFTNYDVAKLLQIQGGAENGVQLAAGDALLGDCKRDACAECIVQCISQPHKMNLVFSIISNEQAAFSEEEWTQAFQSLA
jgi:nucleoside-diphosphate-sugar epimerase